MFSLMRMGCAPLKQLIVDADADVGEVLRLIDALCMRHDGFEDVMNRSN